MRKLIFKKNSNAVSLFEIQRVEKILDVSFPQNYIEFLSINNGEDLIECNFVKEKDWILSINNLYKINTSGYDSLEKIAKMFYEKFMSKHFLPFGDDSDWIFVISLRQQDYNYVYAYRTDEVEDECLILLSTSFNEFIENLQTSTII